jgi:hypothetical protein
MKISLRKLVCNKLAHLLRMKRPLMSPKDDTTSAKNAQCGHLELGKKNVAKENTILVEDLSEKNETTLVKKPIGFDSHEIKEDDTMVKHMQAIENILRETQNDKESDDDLEEKVLKYKFAALVLDRFFFCLSGTYFIVAFSALVLSLPNFYKFKMIIVFILNYFLNYFK